MAKRRFRNKKVRYVAIGASLVTGAAVATVLLPSANAAEKKTPEEIVAMCQRAAVLNGKQQSVSDFGADFGTGFAADNCDYVETKFETFNGPTEKVTIDFPNCESNATEPSNVTTTFTKTVAQGQGLYKITQQGASGGLFGLLNFGWQKHKGTLDLTLNSTTASESEQRQVPIGKVMHITFTPKMQRMTGEWRVRIDAEEASTVGNATPEQNFVAEEVVVGPVVLKGAAGAPGLADGTSKVVLENC